MYCHISLRTAQESGPAAGHMNLNLKYHLNPKLQIAYQKPESWNITILILMRFVSNEENPIQH